jgi:glutamyl-tRNA synthetase
MGDVNKTIKKYALENAIQYKGTANPKALIGKVLGQFPDKRENVKETNELIQSIVDEVNKLSLEEQKKELENLAPGLLDEKDKEKEKRKGSHGDLKELKNAIKGQVVLRIEPSPSGALHIGHAHGLSLNHLYQRMYHGKLILRISDTAPGNIDPKAYKLLEQDANWLTNNEISEIVIQSDRMEIYYEKALQLIEENFAYVCTCKQEDFKNFSLKKEICPCRDLGQDLQLQRWSSMFRDYSSGDAVVRAKSNMQDPNPAMRDFPLLRISDEEHPRQQKKYRVWPLMNFAVAVDDHELGLTHVLRGKDHFDNTKRQKIIFDAFKWDYPEYVHTGMINFEGLKLSASETRAGIEEGKFTGWDDIRLPFLQALKRRGFKPEAIVNFMRGIGATLNDKTVKAEDFFKSIEHHNKQLIEDSSNRYFFVEDPVEIEIENAPVQDIELDLHPDNKKGGRFFKTNNKFIISRNDFHKIQEGEIWRLMDCFNFVKKDGKFEYHSKEYNFYKENGKGIIHWLPNNDKLVDVKVRRTDNTIAEGKAETLVSGIELGTLVQFERFGFVRKDKEEFWFLHG